MINPRTFFGGNRMQTVRHFSSMSPMKFEVLTWPPGKKITGDTIASMPALDAKRASYTSRDIEVLGHAAAQISFDLSHPKEGANLKEMLRKNLYKHNIDSSVIEKLKKIESYASWFPDADRRHYKIVGEPIDYKKFAKSLLGSKTKDIFPKDLEDKSEKICNFLSLQIKAINSDLQADIYQYGPVAKDRRLLLPDDLDHEAVFLCLTKMMRPKISRDGAILRLDEALPNAAYFGAHTLLKYAEYFSDKSDKNLAEILQAIINPSYVCTTLVLDLMEAGIGNERAKEIAKRVMETSDVASVTGGIPLVDFTHRFAQSISHQPMQQDQLRDDSSFRI